MSMHPVYKDEYLKSRINNGKYNKDDLNIE